MFVICTTVTVVRADNANDPSWAQVYKQHGGTVTAVWFESRPFIYRDTDGNMKGIEYELLEGFAAFVQREYNVELTIEWREGKSFSDTYAALHDQSQNSTFGVSAFSITAKRNEQVDFSPPYMSDISVLITSDNIPVLSNVDALYALLPKLNAVTIRETTYEQELKRLQNEGRLRFNIDYIPSEENIMLNIAARDSAFGLVDLPVYMMLFHEDPSIKITRQNLLPLKRHGYAIIYRENSDWRMPLEDYFNQPHFKASLKKIIARYIDVGLYEFVEQLAEQSSDETIMLLTKEKEIQYRDLLGKADIIMKETRLSKFLFALTIITLISLVVILSLYRKRNEQKRKIEAQGKILALKSEELEQRNQHLLALDEEKNNLIRILAHDLRAPVNHIQGMAQLVLLERSRLTGDQHMFVEKIVDSSVRVSKMISHLLDIDALENDRVKIFLEKIDITALIKKVVDSFEKQAQQKHTTLAFSASNDAVLVNGDALYLFEIFENLVSNAIKFSPLQSRVDVCVTVDDSSVTIAVKDSGPGLTADDQLLLFKKYQRLSAKPTNGEASVGLGLSIVKQYVELMKGEVWCDSEPGKGAAFFVRFPRA